MKTRLALILVGGAFGFALHRAGFASWDEIHAMFAFTGFRLLFGFMMGVMLLSLAWQVIARVQHPTVTPRRFHPGTIPGGILFGAGWALCGGCPSIALAQLGSGKLIALVTVAGIFVGNMVYPLLHARFFGWSLGSCVDD